jgi:ParB family chromosome partitioning protein
MSEVPVIVKAIDDQTAMALALIENMQRDDLKPLEEATAIQRLIHECNLTHQQVAQAIGKSRATVSNLLRLLELHPEVRTLLEQGELDMGHARTLLGLTGEAQHQAALQVVNKNLTVRATEALVRQQLSDEPITTSEKTTQPPQVYQAQLEQLTSTLGVPVSLQPTGKSQQKGKLVIKYNTPEQLEILLTQLQQNTSH